MPLVRAFAWLLMTVLGPLRVRGQYRVPKRGGVLILANHQADLDPVVVQLACPRPVHFMAKHELFEIRFLGRFMRWFNAFPVHRGEPDRSAVKRAIKLLQEGEVVAMYPEGEVSETHNLLPILPGAGLIVRMSGAMVICLGIKGSYHALPYGSLVPRPGFRTIQANWGEPRMFSRQDSIEEIVTWVEGQLRSLTDQERA